MPLTRPLSAVAGVARPVWHDVSRAWAGLIVFEAGFKLLQAWLLLPAVAAALSAVMARAGAVAVSDWDILDFLLTPLGVLYAVVLGTTAAALLLFEQAGVTAVIAHSAGGDRGRPSAWAAVGTARRVARVGAIQFGLLAATAVPFVAALAATHAALLARYDINFYLAERPAEFWAAAVIGGLVAAAATGVGLRLIVRYAFAVPVLLFEGATARQALRVSRERVRGVGLAVGLVLVGWQAGAVVAAAGLHAGFRLLAARLPDGATENPAVLAVLLTVRGTLLAAVSAVAAVGQAAFVYRLYLSRAGEPSPAAGDPAEPRSRRSLAVPVAVLIGLPAVVWAGVAAGPAGWAGVKVTAHRGDERAAPENTLAAIRAAAAGGADYAEVDAQLTADGHAVLAHDRDLKRTAGDPRRVGEMTLADVKKLDAGRWFGPAFAGERVPTLAEAVETARGRIGLNVELKYYAPDAGLAAEVARVLTAAGAEGTCLVTSFDRAALAEVRRLNPRLRTGPIVSAALGDVARLDGDLLSVRADLVTDRLLADCQRRGRAVHAWTVNDERHMVRLALRGVDNLITSEPGRAVAVRDRLARLTDAERLVLSSRTLLGLD